MATVISDAQLRLLRQAGPGTVLRRLVRRLWSDVTVVNVALDADATRGVPPQPPELAVEVIPPSSRDLHALVATTDGSDALLMRRMLRRSGVADQSLLLARLDGHAVGVCAVVRPRHREGPGHTAEGTPGWEEALIGSLYLVPAARGRGVGALLITAAADVGMRSGASRLIAAIDEGNEASMRTFARVGFVPVTRTRTRFRLNHRHDRVEPIRH